MLHHLLSYLVLMLDGHNLLQDNYILCQLRSLAVTKAASLNEARKILRMDKSEYHWICGAFSNSPKCAITYMSDTYYSPDERYMVSMSTQIKSEAELLKSRVTEVELTLLPWNRVKRPAYKEFDYGALLRATNSIKEDKPVQNAK